MSSTTHPSPRKRAPIVSQGAQLRPSGQISQEVSALLQAVDSIQHSQNENEELLRIALDDSAVLAMAREIGQAKGEDLDDEKLREALDEVRAQRYVFQPAGSALSTSMATAWATRQSWGPKWRLRGLTGLASVVVATGTIMTVDTIQENRWVSNMESTRTNETEIRQSLDAALTRAVQDPNAPLAVSSQISAARDALSAGIEELGKAPTVPPKDTLVELYENDRDQAKELLSERQTRLRNAWAQHERAKSSLEQANSLGIAFGDAGLFDQPIAVALTGLRDEQRVAFQMAAQQGNPEGMRQAVNKLNEAISIIRVKDAVATQASNLSPSTQAQLSERLDNVVKAAAAGQIEYANTMIEDTRNLLAQASLGYTLKILSEPGHQSGVWRYYGSDRSAKNFYVVVDAIGLDGRPVELPITSVEDKKTKMTSRFAVRVPEEVFKQVGEDKSDGIVDNDLMAEKAVGELEPKYAFPVLGGAITDW